MWCKCIELPTKQTRKGEHIHRNIRIATVEHATISEEQSKYFPFLYTEREDALQSVVLQRHYKLAMSFSLNNNKIEYGLSISCCRD